MARRKRTASRREPDAIDERLESGGARCAEDFEALAGQLKQALAERMLNVEMDVPPGTVTLRGGRQSNPLFTTRD
jgi:hypothetical protein